MNLKALSSEGKIAYLIKPILKVLQEAGGQLERSEIKERISDLDDQIAEYAETEKKSKKTGNVYKEFNFKFNLDEDMYTTSAIDLLQQSGIDFNKFNTDGIEIYEFTQLLYTSGLVMNNDVYYITFHSSYDFGYILKILTCKPLPLDDKEFMKTLHVLIPHFYDLKVMIDENEQISCGGLQGLANELDVERVGPQHQAGSDALVTLKTFTALMKRFFNGDLVNKNFENKLYGLNNEY